MLRGRRGLNPFTWVPKAYCADHAEVSPRKNCFNIARRRWEIPLRPLAGEGALTASPCREATPPLVLLRKPEGTASGALIFHRLLYVPSALHSAAQIQSIRSVPVRSAANRRRAP